ncbi:MAG: protein translocase subunit SecF, partial [Alphaproteobacteria bacterium]|nr:protein translocase subunit SecF [Alphaproteobacteria bacterium]
MLLRLWPEKTEFKFMSLRYVAIVVSLLALAASAAMLATRGLNLGIDFAGGSVIEIVQPEGTSTQDVRDVITPLGLGDVSVNSARGTGEDAQDLAVIRFETQAPQAGEDPDEVQKLANERVVDTLIAELGLDREQDFRSISSVGPKVSGELFRSGIIALSVALLLMMVYISFRFQWQYALGAVVALFHDVILTMGVFALTGFEFNLATIAALLTIVGYSMNDTVIVFDRVREEARKYKKMPLSEVIDLAINATMSRTLLTSGTTLLALVS